MSALSRFRNWLYESSVKGVEVDDQKLLEIHADVLRRKPLLRSAFMSFYRDMINKSDALLTGKGLEIELGSGAGFFREFRPNLITSDVRIGKHIDRVLDAQHMDIPDGTVRCIYAINVFHHLPDPKKFFSELERVLVKGGGCILVEPHSGFASALLHRYLHTDERFDPDEKNWDNPEIRGPLSGANQALAHIVFNKDRGLFERLYGDSLEIASVTYVDNSLRYLLSGGLNFRQLVPTWMNGALMAVERLGKPVGRFWSLHQVIVIRRRL